VHNVLSKIFGNSNPVNVAKATMNALLAMQSAEDVADLRGVELQLFHPQAGVDETEEQTAAPVKSGDAPAAEKEEPSPESDVEASAEAPAVQAPAGDAGDEKPAGSAEVEDVEAESAPEPDASGGEEDQEDK
jgi:hypothetical protein